MSYFLDVCKAPDPQQHIRSLSDADLNLLNGECKKLPTSGIGGVVRSLADAEVLHRFFSKEDQLRRMAMSKQVEETSRQISEFKTSKS